MNNPTYTQLMRVGELQEIIRYAENRMREPKQDPFSGYAALLIQRSPDSCDNKIKC